MWYFIPSKWNLVVKGYCTRYRVAIPYSIASYAGLVRWNISELRSLDFCQKDHKSTVILSDHIPLDHTHIVRQCKAGMEMSSTSTDAENIINHMRNATSDYAEKKPSSREQLLHLGQALIASLELPSEQFNVWVAQKWVSLAKLEALSLICWADQPNWIANCRMAIELKLFEVLTASDEHGISAEDLAARAQGEDLRYSRKADSARQGESHLESVLHRYSEHLWGQVSRLLHHPDHTEFPSVLFAFCSSWLEPPRLYHDSWAAKASHEKRLLEGSGERDCRTKKAGFKITGIWSLEMGTESLIEAELVWFIERPSLQRPKASALDVISTCGWFCIGFPMVRT